MVTEQEAFAALPSTGWLRDYAIYAAKQTTAPLVYHLGVGLAVLATSAPITFGTVYATPIYANTYVMLAGRSGDDQKSTAIRLGRDILYRACPQRIGEHPASVENLVESLSKRPAQILIYEEGGFLLAGVKHGYKEPLKPALTHLADGDPLQHNRVSKQGKEDKLVAETPRLSMLTGASLAFLEKHTESADWTGGFLGRWIVFYGKRERTDPYPIPKLEGRDALVAAIKARAGAQVAGWCVGPNAEAMDVWHDWYHNVMNRPMPELIAGARTRAPVIALRTALLLGWDYGPAPYQAQWQIGLDVLIPAIMMAELHLKSIAGLADRLAAHPDAILRRKVLDAFSPGELLPIGDVLKRTKYRMRMVTEILGALVEEGTLRRVQVPGGVVLYGLNIEAGG